MLEKLVQEELKHGIAVEDQAMQSAAVRKRASCIENSAAFSFDEPQPSHLNTAKPAYHLLSAFFRIHGPFQDRESPRKRVPCHNQLLHARSNTVPGSRTYAARTKPIHPVSRGRPSSAGPSQPPHCH